MYIFRILINTILRFLHSFVNLPIYDYQGISDGKGPGRNVQADDKLTRGNMVSKPDDRLAEKDLNLKLHKIKILVRKSTHPPS